MDLKTKHNICKIKLNEDLDVIIQAFINVYGTEYSDFITNRFKELKIIWYDDEIQNYSDINDIIETSLPKEIIDEYLKKYKEKCFSQSAFLAELDVLILPLSYNITHIIHEINHMISCHVLSKNPLRIISGLSIITEQNNGIVSNDNDLNEIINQKITIEILEELKRLGIDLKISSSWQEQSFPVINLFYKTFKDEIKKTYVTGNLLSFAKNLGGQNYIDFTQVVFLKCFKARRNISKGETKIISKDDIEQVEALVFMMNETKEQQNIKR